MITNQKCSMSNQYKLNFTHVTSYDEHDVFSHVQLFATPGTVAFLSNQKQGLQFSVYSLPKMPKLKHKYL